MLDYIWLIPLSPLIGFLINGLLGRKIDKDSVGYIGCGVVGLSFVLAVLSLFSLLQLTPEQRVFEKILYTWIESGGFKAEIGFQLDPLSAIMILVVSGIGLVIHIYSIGYMHDDEGYPRYFSYLNLFTFAMLLLVLANNLLLMFIGWEGVGLCSYLLIGFWFEKRSASDAGKKAFVVNRIGDFGFILGIMLIFVTFGTIDLTDVFHSATEGSQAGIITTATFTAITLLLFLGAVGKSAQIPLYTWLPDAMEGPTPVSALIHAATMVTAGVYMVARCSVLYMLAPISMTVVAGVGVATAIYAGSIGLAQNDIKRVLAYSTVSQLGYMFLACGVGAFGAGIFHLMTHAFFKACLFLGSGSIIHALGGEQDMRRMGGLKGDMPTTYWTFLIASLAIAGIPPFAGFFSKDEILWKALTKGNILLWGIGALGGFITAFYMFRLIFMTFWGESRVDKEVARHLHESPMNMTIPLIILAILSTIGGFVGIPLIKGWNKIDRFLSPVFGGHGVSEPVHHSVSLELELGMILISIIIASAGIYLAYKMYVISPNIPERFTKRYQTLYRVILNKYYIDDIYDALIVMPIKNGANLLWKGFDDLVIDGIVNGIAYLVEQWSKVMRIIQSGYVRDYAFSMVIGLVIMLLFFL
ncbi:MAG: NADH-quinone oxidoreductase subunit L [Nitrospinae bacterium]|nr:NADH-quinone oxidoreductase subunit L [Nitrospinota bacterium]